MPEAIIKGEMHASRSDKQDLEGIDTSDFDAVCFESHDKDFFARTLTLRYALYCIGHILYGATAGRVYTSTDSFKSRLHTDGVPTHDVDADVHEQYGFVATWAHWVMVVASLGVGAGVAAVPAAVVVVVVQQVDYMIGMILAIAVFSLLWGFAWALSYNWMHGYPAMKHRDQFMADTIQWITAVNDYDRVLVACGDGHVEGIRRLLKEEGWTIKADRSRSLLARLQRLFQ